MSKKFTEIHFIKITSVTAVDLNCCNIMYARHATQTINKQTSSKKTVIMNIASIAPWVYLKRHCWQNQSIK